ncbi:MAG: hypothetical protein ABI601_17890 [bacterium]
MPAPPHRMAIMTGDAGPDVLRMMSDPEAALLVLARTAQARKEGAPIPDAATLAAKEDDTLERVKAMLVRNYSDAFASKAILVPCTPHRVLNAPRR